MTSAATPAVIRTATWLYRRLMILLPGEFKRRHSQDVAETFRDACFDGYQSGKTFGVVVTLVQGVFGLLVVAVREPFRSSRKIQPRGQHEHRKNIVAHVAQDVVFAARSYRRNPGFAFTSIAIIALGIGATTTIFSVVDGVVLRPLPYPEPDKIVYVDNGSHPPPIYRDWQDGASSFESMSAVWDMGLDLLGEGAPERLNAAAVTKNFFQTFGAQPALGRLFVPGDYNGLPEVIAISHGLWHRRFGGSPDILGRTLRLGEETFVVVGVVDPRFSEPERVVRTGTDVWLPLDETREDLQREGFYAFDVVARLSDGVSLENAQSEFNTLVGNLDVTHPGRYRWDDELRSFPLLPLHTATVSEVDDALLMLLGAVGLLLLIACANVANLFLARGMDRGREMSLRAALGAGRGRLMSQLLTESVVLALIGGVIGVALAFGGVRALEVLNPGELPRADAIAVNIRVLAFAVCVAVGTGVLFGVAPALRASKTDHGSAIKESSKSVTGGKSGNKLRNALVVSEIALALMLATGAGLLINSFVRLKNVDPGFVTEQLLTIPLVFGPDVPVEQKQTLTDQLLDRVAAVPGVQAVTGGVLVPYQHYGGSRCCRMWGNLRTSEGIDIENERILVHPVSANYFTLLGANLRGSDFRVTDNVRTPAPVIMSEALAAKMFGTDDPLGKIVTGADTEFEVVGVVENFMQWGLDQDASIEMFVPYRSFIGGSRNFNVVIKTERPLAAIADNLRAAVWDVLPAMPVNEIYTMRQRMSESMSTPRFYSVMLATFGGVALLLAAGGVYGSMLYSVGRRNRELGVRMALGATSSNVTGMVLRQGVVLAGVGIAIGLVGSIALGRVLDSFMFGITTTDGFTLGVVSVVLATVAIASSYLPARKAAYTDPIEVLRSE